LFIRQTLTITVTILTIVSLAIFINVVYSEEEYIVSVNYLVPLTVNGVEAQPPVKVSPRDIVCVKELIVYIHQSKRLAFRGWSDGVLDQCRIVKGNLTAIYDMEVLLQVYAEPRNLRKSEWVKVGTLVKLDYPEYFYEDGVRYVFESWSGGETPFQPNNVIYITEPTRLEAFYVKEYLITAVGANINGTGWYREGETAVLATPPVIYVSPQERLVFSRWESVGSKPVLLANPNSPTTTLQVKGPYILKALYDKQYWVEVTSPKGVVYKGWVREGDTLRISVDQTINLEEGVRLRFARWSWDEIPPVPEITLQIHQPINLTAYYIKQYYVKVDSQYGASGGGWYDEGSLAVIRANPQPPTNILINRVLVGYSGDCGEMCEAPNGLLKINVDSPKTIRAVYTTEPNLLTIGIITGIGGALVTVYALTSRKKPEEVEVKIAKTVEVKAQQKELLKDPSRALFKCTECGATIRGDKEALKHVRKHKFSHPVIEYVALEEIAEPINSKTAILWTNGLKLRITPPNQLTVKDLVKPGDIVKYSETDERLKVVSIERHEKHGLPVYTIVGVPLEGSNEKKYYKYINDLVAQDGKILCIYEECDCQVYVEKHTPTIKTHEK